MSFNGSGVYTAPAASFPAVANTLIESAKFNAIINDIATALTTCVTKDGQTTTTVSVPFAAGIKVDTIAENTSATGVTVDGVLLKDSQVTTDVILEKTAAAGVTADGVLLKDGGATLKDSVTQFQDDSDATKQMRFQLSGITTGNVRTLTVPDASTTLVGTDTTQTLTNKTISGGSVTGITDLAVADGGTGASTFTDGGVLIGNGAGAIQVTSAGTSGQVLTSNGAGVDPTFQTAPGSLVLLGTLTASNSAELAFTAFSSATYGDYLFFFSRIRPATDGAQLQAQVSVDGGSNYRSTAGDYVWQTSLHGINSNFSTGSSSDTKIGLSSSGATNGIGNTVPKTFDSQLTLHSPGDGNNIGVDGQIGYGRATDGTRLGGSASAKYIGTTDAVNGIKFFMDSGNITSGTIRVYGVKK